MDTDVRFGTAGRAGEAEGAALGDAEVEEGSGGGSLPGSGGVDIEASADIM